MSPACKLWDLIITRGLEQASSINAIFLSIVEAKACWRAIVTCLKNWMQKDKDKWFLDRVSWKWQAHFLMKWSMSCLGVSCTSMAIRIKWCLSWSPLYLWILAVTLSSAVALVGWLITLKATISYVEVVTITLTMKAWSFWMMKWSACNEIPNVKAYHRSFQTLCPFFRTRAYMTSRMTLCVTIHWPPNKQWAKCVLNVSNSCLIRVHTHKWKD